MNREQRRKLKKQTDIDENLSKKIFLFNKLPEKCDTCDEPYDKSDKALASQWRVVVKHEEEVVRLFCPECHKKAVRIMETMETADDG